MTWLQELKAAGYFTAYPGKTDFNFEAPKDWVNTTQDWTKRPELLPNDRPFFAYINYTISHESQARANETQREKNAARLKPQERRDPARVSLPPYYPDTPAVRRVVANYHDTVTAVDYLVGDVLKLMDDRGWSQNTILFCFSDHGWGLPRGKRWTYDSGTRVPLLVRFPDRYGPQPTAGTTREDLTCFLDLGPTVLSLAGVTSTVPRPGRVLFGPQAGPEPEFVVSCRDRMDEVPDRVRSLRTRKYRYVRNFEPEVPYFAWLNYLDENPIMKDWRRLAFAGELNPTQKLFWSRTKPIETLYDLDHDPHEIRNLAQEPEHQERLAWFRQKLETWMETTGDLGRIPERELIQRGVVKNVLDTEYAQRVKLHPQSPPVPE
jgi:uncharacterized sulfatase